MDQQSPNLHKLSRDQTDPWNQLAELLEHISPPRFIQQDFNLLDFGALTNGATLDTMAFRSAIEACSKAGGGRVIVPAGTYLTGAIHMKSNVDLHLQKGARILFSPDPDEYMPLVYTRWEGVELMNYSPFIYAFEQENIAITGEGVLDGGASKSNWWRWRGDEQWGWQEGMEHQGSQGNRDTLFDMGESDVPVQERRFGKGCFLRPAFVQFYRCRNILMEGITLVNSPMWAINPVLCSNVTVQRVVVDSEGPSVDGCTPESCNYVLISDCHFSVSHDCISLKSGRNRDGRRINVPTKNVLIQNCTFANGHGGVTIGSETSGGIHHIYVRDCSFSGPQLLRALRIKTNAKRGGVIESIFLRNIKVGQVQEQPVSISMHYEESGDYMPVIKNIDIRNVLVERGGKTGILLKGLEQSPIQSICLQQVNIEKVEEPYKFVHAKNVVFKKVTINGIVQ